MTSSIVNKILHSPVIYLKKDAPPEEKKLKLALIRKFFDLDPDNSD